jgi:cation transport regulator
MPVLTVGSAGRKDCGATHRGHVVATGSEGNDAERLKSIRRRGACNGLPASAPMPYDKNDELPPSVRNPLPPRAQDIFRTAFNRAVSKKSDEVTAFRIAWAAVRHQYQKIDGEWTPRSVT